MMMVHRHRFGGALAKVSLFRNLPRERLDILGSLFVIKVVEKGTFILREGEPSMGLFLLVRGTVQIFSHDGGTRGARFLCESDLLNYFGEVSLLKNSSVTANVLAEEECQILHLKAKSFRTFLSTVDETVKRELELTVSKRSQRRLSQICPYE